MSRSIDVSLPGAVVFDCDGTLLDSERVTAESMAEVLASMGHELAAGDVAAMVGHPWPHTRAYLVERFGLDDDDVAAYREGMRAHAVPRLRDPTLVFDDVLDVIDRLQAADVPMAVCTSSGRDHLERVLDLAPLRGVFDAAVAREDTPRHKPDPLPYVTAIARLASATGRELAAARVSVVEDSWAGVAAGVAAGCWTVAVDRGADLHDLDHAHAVVRRLTVDALVRRA